LVTYHVDLSRRALPDRPLVRAWPSQFPGFIGYLISRGLAKSGQSASKSWSKKRVGLLIMPPSFFLVVALRSRPPPHTPAFVTFFGCLVAEDEHLTAGAPGGSDVSIILVLTDPQLVVDGIGTAWPAAL
jgi:hypothetical protein